MEEALRIIDRLWKGETITEDGPPLHAQGRPPAHARRPPAADLDLRLRAAGAREAAAAGATGCGPCPTRSRRPGRRLPRGAARGRRAATGEIVFQALFSWAAGRRRGARGRPQVEGRAAAGALHGRLARPGLDVRARRGQMSDDEFARERDHRGRPRRPRGALRELEELGATVIVLQNNSGADPLRRDQRLRRARAAGAARAALARLEAEQAAALSRRTALATSGGSSSRSSSDRQASGSNIG